MVIARARTYTGEVVRFTTSSRPSNAGFWAVGRLQTNTRARPRRQQSHQRRLRGQLSPADRRPPPCAVSDSAGSTCKGTLTPAPSCFSRAGRPHLRGPMTSAGIPLAVSREEEEVLRADCAS
jgi:hypothetical protein